MGQGEHAPESGIGGSGKRERAFTYDALYRLLTATGRETAPADASVSPWDDQTRPVDPTLSAAYTQQYGYDLLGNLLSLQQTGARAFTRTFGYEAAYDEPGGTNHLQQVQVGVVLPKHQQRYILKNAATCKELTIGENDVFAAAKRLIDQHLKMELKPPSVLLLYFRSLMR